MRPWVECEDKTCRYAGEAHEHPGGIAHALVEEECED